MLQRARPSPAAATEAPRKSEKYSSATSPASRTNDPAVLREQAAGHQAGIRKGGVAVLVAVLKEMAEFFRKLQERKGNLRKGGGNLVQLLYYSRVHSVVNDVNVIKASGTGVKAKGVNGYAQGQAPAAGGGKHDGDA